MTDQELFNDEGTAVLSYREDGRTARDVEVRGPGAAKTIMAKLGGWTVMGPAGLGRELVALGATCTRHGHGMVRDLIADPPPADWAELVPTGELRLTPVDKTAEQLSGLWAAAYPPGHPDHAVSSDPELQRRLMAGESLGLVLPISALVVDGTDRPVACVLVNEGTTDPWITQVCRDPAPRFAGLGGLLLRKVIAAAASDGLSTIGLAVTEGNPARRLYERLGFQLVESTMTVRIP